MSTYILIHGAWHGGWCWRKIIPLLESKGHTVLAPDLPGHGDDKIPVANVTLDSYADSICKLARAQSEKVILLGHSMGGVVITQAGERCADNVGALVYLCAFLPRNGESLMTWASQDQLSMVNPSTTDPQKEGTLAFKSEFAREAFYGLCAEDDINFARERLIDQPAAPFATPVETSQERWGSIPRYYIECLRDRAISIGLQREMQKQSPCQKTFSIDTDHSPFFSAAEELAEILAGIKSA